MKTVKYLLIGAGLSSCGAARRIREIDSTEPILIVGQEPHAPYDRPPLSKEYMQGRKKTDDIFLQKPSWYTQANVSMLLGPRVASLDANARTVTLDTGEMIGFDKCLLGMGGRPRKLNVPGADLAGVHYFRTMDDAMAVSQAAGKGGRAVIIGGGFIGMELASSLTQRGMSVSLVQHSPHIWPQFLNDKLAVYFEQYCIARGVTFCLGREVRAIGGDGQASSVALDNGQQLACDLVVIAVGIDPNVELASAAGLTVDNGVVVDEFMQTSHRGIFAAGDVANYPDPYFGTRRRVEHWGQADYTGPLAGANMAGRHEAYDLLTYVWSDIFDLHLEFGGNEHHYDQLLIRGQMSDNAFSVLYLKDGRMTAFFAVNQPKKQYTPFNKLIQQKVPLAGKEAQLQDPTFEVKTLIPEPIKV